MEGRGLNVTDFLQGRIRHGQYKKVEVVHRCVLVYCRCQLSAVKVIYNMIQFSVDFLIFL